MDPYADPTRLKKNLNSRLVQSGTSAPEAGISPALAASPPALPTPPFSSPPKRPDPPQNIPPPPPESDPADFYRNDAVPAPTMQRPKAERRPPGHLAETLELWPGQVYAGNPERTRLIAKMGRAINAATRNSLFGNQSIPTNAESAERAWNIGLEILQNRVPAAQSALVDSVFHGNEKQQRDAQARYQNLLNEAHDLLDHTIGYTMAAEDLGKPALSLEELHNWQDDRMREMEAMRTESGALESPPIDPIDLATGGVASGLKSSFGKGIARTTAREAAQGAAKGLAAEWGEELAEDGVRAMKMPKVDADVVGPGRAAVTLPNGDVYLKPGMSRPMQAYALKHEGVHSFFSPKGVGRIAQFRQNLGQAAYENSELLRYVEEALAEGNASKSLTEALKYPLKGYGITWPGLLSETAALGGTLYEAFRTGKKLGEIATDENHER